MTITAGTRLVPYEIVAPIGAGGMGEVWKARDTRLDRSVAIKILPAGCAHDAQFKMRFEREKELFYVAPGDAITSVAAFPSVLGDRAGAHLTDIHVARSGANEDRPKSSFRTIRD